MFCFARQCYYQVTYAGVCHARPLHIEQFMESCLFSVTALCTEIRPLQVLFAWSIFCILARQSSVQLSIEFDLRGHQQSIIWVINCKTFSHSLYVMIDVNLFC